MNKKITFWELLKLCWNFTCSSNHISFTCPLFYFYIADRSKAYNRDVLESGVDFRFIPRWPIYEGDEVFRHCWSSLKVDMTLKEYVMSRLK